MHADPDVPKFYVDLMSERAVKVTWQLPDDDQMMGSSFYVNYAYSGCKISFIEILAFYFQDPNQPFGNAPN